ncbi:MAG: glycosyltransferase family 2 protein, partial [Bacteroidota bacterium]
STHSVKLSIVIVNYNVKYFLEQCLQSVELASKNLAVEVWVVDNHSKDGSVEMIKNKFPSVKLIANQNNPGFSIANNQAIQQSEGTYILLLNPDTIVEEDTFVKCINYLDNHPKVGGLGIKMIDGSGQFLPESKRGFPTPFVAFCKTFGLSRLFPKSKRFNRYHLGFLSKDENHPVEVLAGAFMLLRKSVLEKVGLLDETFFMYGEDIDLSYRIVQAGFENHFFAESKILHYKGESTKKGSLNYVRFFYQAMIIFAQKHFQGSKGKLFVGMLRLAIYFRAGLTLISNLTKRGFQPVLDLLLLYFGLFFLKDFWGIYHFNSSDYYGPQFLYVNAPLYTSIWMVSLYLNGAYDKGVSAKRILRGILVGTIIIAAIYGFLDLAYRSSRMLILLGTVWGAFSLILVRYIGRWLGTNSFQTTASPKSRLLIVGSKDESKRVQDLLGQVNINKNFLGTVAPKSQEPDQDFLGGANQIDQWIDLYQANEIIFCLQDVPAQFMLQTMENCGPKISYRSVPKDSQSII